MARNVTRSAGAVAAVAAGITAVRRLQRRVVFAGISGPVVINRDRLGIPHIIAESRRDAAFGFGFAVAEDRLFQMDLFRRTAYGQLSEIVGPAALSSDRFMRMLGIHLIADDLVRAASPESRAFIEAFASGVNLRMARRSLPLECRILRYRPAPWRAADSLALLRLLGWNLSSFHLQDLIAELLRETIGDEWTDAIVAGRVAESPVVMREPTRPFPTVADAPFSDVVAPPGGASNAWAVSGARSVTGAPLLANDPHLGLTNPSIWSEASIECPDMFVAGVTMPGVPGILIGRTSKVAWGITAAMISQTFLYRERLSADGSQVWDGETWVPIEERVESIEVRDQPSDVYRVRITPRGPLYSDYDNRWSTDHVSLHWTGMTPSADIDALLTLNSAATTDDAVKVRSILLTPTVNVVVADAGGDIACMSVGAMADRTAGAGLLDPADFPPRYIPSEQLPGERNPVRGWVATANNRIVKPDYPYSLHGFYEPKYRIHRISDALDSRSRHSLADMRTLQLDIFSEHAAEFTPILLDLLDGDAPPWAIDDLATWDFQTTAESRPTLLFEAFHHQWVTAVLRHRLPDELATILQTSLATGDIPMGFCDRVLKGELPDWMGDSDRQRIARASFLEALRWIVGKIGPDHETWTWGKLHTITFVHPLGMKPGVHRRFVNIGPIELGGDRTTVWPSGGKPTDLFSVTGGPSMRFVTDLRSPRLAWITNTLGQSGRLRHRQSRNQVQDWVTGQMHALTGNPALGTTLLRPGGTTRP